MLTSLADDAAVERVYLGENGVVGAIRPDAIAVDTSTIDPRTTEKVGAAVDATGAGFLDCPVSGSVSVVEAGNLTIMVGGDTGAARAGAAGARRARGPNRPVRPARARARRPSSR